MSKFNFMVESGDFFVFDRSISTRDIVPYVLEHLLGDFPYILILHWYCAGSPPLFSLLYVRCIRAASPLVTVKKTSVEIRLTNEDESAATGNHETQTQKSICSKS